MIQHTADTPPRIHVRTLCMLCMAWLLTLLATAGASGQCQYEVTAIIEGPGCWPSNNPTPLIARGMNSHGHVVGHVLNCDFSGHDIGFFWTPETGRVLMHNSENVWRVNPMDINDAGLIVGSLQITGIGQLGFVYDMHTQEYLAYLPPLQGAGGSSLNAINNAGIAVGSRAIGKPGVHPIPYNAVIWNPITGEITDLGVGKGPNSAVMDQTDSGEMAGWSGSDLHLSDARALLWAGGGVVELGYLPGAAQSSARRMNSHLEVIGYSSAGGLFDPLLAFIWREGNMAHFAPPPGYDRVGLSDINDAGQMVGRIQVEGTSTWHPFLWQHDAFYDLRDLVVNGPDSLIITGASNVLSNGLIRASTGTKAVLLTPIDQPLGDLNHDCQVDVYDLLTLLDSWGPIPRAAQQQTGLTADLNGDGVVNVSDLLILLANWSH
jgi:uncharacterized membrane protein